MLVKLIEYVHLLERGEGRQDGAANPHGVLTLRRSDDLDLHGGRSKGHQLLGHALADAAEHGGAAGEDDVRVEILTDIDIALHDGLEREIRDTRSFLAQNAV